MDTKGTQMKHSGNVMETHTSVCSTGASTMVLPSGTLPLLKQHQPLNQ